MKYNITYINGKEETIDAEILLSENHYVKFDSIVDTQKFADYATVLLVPLDMIFKVQMVEE